MDTLLTPALPGLVTTKSSHSKWDKALADYFEEGSTSLVVNLHLTRQCNFKCGHCMNFSSMQMPKGYMTEETMDLLSTYLSQLKAAHPYANVELNLVGGEPTLNMKEFERCYSRLSEMARLYGCSLEMTTNGWWMRTWRDTCKFFNIVGGDLLDETIRIRISSSPFHSEFRKEEAKFFRPVTTSYGKRPTLTLWAEAVIDDFLTSASPFKDVAEVYESVSEEIKANNPDLDEDGIYSLVSYKVEQITQYAGSGVAYEIAGLISEGKGYNIYIGDIPWSPDTISPVGRARKIEARQDGPCGLEEWHITFLPDGEVHDLCCSGGRTVKAHLKDGFWYLAAMYVEFMESLYDAYPGPTSRAFQRNPLQGARCLACPAFGKSWMAKRHPALEQSMRDYQHTRQQQKEAAYHGN